MKSRRRQGRGSTSSESDLFLPKGVGHEVAERLAVVLDELYPSPDDENERYRATKHLLWAAMAIMINRKLPPSTAVQTVLSVMAELLVDGFGTAGAAQHLHQMADALEKSPSRSARAGVSMWSD